MLYTPVTAGLIFAGKFNFGFVILGVMVALFGTMAFVLVRMLKKTNNTGGQPAESGKVSISTESSQNFVPFSTVENDVMYLGGYEYRAIIEVSSVNYHFKNPDEQDALENSFSTLLNMIQYPFSMFVQTREIDINDIVVRLSKNIDQTVAVFPGLADYGRNYLAYMRMLKAQTGCTKQKKKYIVLSCNEGNVADGESDADRKTLTVDALKERVDLVRNNLSAVGLTSRMLTTPEIVELFYSLTHREDDSIVDGIRDGQYTADIVCGRKKERLTPLDDAIRIIQEAENKYTLEVMSSDLTPGQKDTLRKFEQTMFDMRQTLQEYNKKGGMDALMSSDELYDKLVAEQGGNE